MLPVTFGESQNGYPVIQIDSPYELFGEFLGSEYSLPRARRVLASIDSVLAGLSSHEEISQDYANLKLRGNVANVWFDNLSKGTEETSNMPLQLFRDVTAGWLAFLESRVDSGQTG